MRLTLLAACAALAAIVSGCTPTVSAANERGGIVEHVTGMRRADALAAADAHCNQYGKIARITGQDGLNSTLSFECVAGD